MTGPRISVTKTTPKPSRRDVHLFSALVLPEERTGSRSWLGTTVGHVLDSAPVDCRVDRWWASANGRFGLRNTACRTYACAWCIDAKLAEGIAPAWAFWGERLVATIDLGPDPKQRGSEMRSLKKAGLKWRGDGSTPGALSIPIGEEGERRVFWPKTAIDLPADEMRTVRRRALDRTLADAIRAIPLNPWDVDHDRGRSEWAGRLPVPLRTAVRIAREEFGVDWEVVTETRARAQGVSLEVKRALIDRLWRG